MFTPSYSSHPTRLQVLYCCTVVSSHKRPKWTGVKFHCCRVCKVSNLYTLKGESVFGTTRMLLISRVTTFFTFSCDTFCLFLLVGGRIFNRFTRFCPRRSCFPSPFVSFFSRIFWPTAAATAAVCVISIPEDACMCFLFDWKKIWIILLALTVSRTLYNFVHSCTVK